MTHEPSNKQSHRTRTHTKQTRNFAIVFCLGMLAGVLIWAKLRLVTDIPRSAYADPREVQELQDQSGEPSKATIEDGTDE